MATLKKTLNRFDGIALLVGITIGSGIFVLHLIQRIRTNNSCKAFILKIFIIASEKKYLFNF